jgi:hypothetical protein
VPQRGARASPSASSRIRRGAAGFPGVRVECGGDVGGQPDALPPSAWSAGRATQKGGRQVVMSSPPEIGEFSGAYGSPEFLPACQCCVHSGYRRGGDRRVVPLLGGQGRRHQ